MNTSLLPSSPARSPSVSHVAFVVLVAGCALHSREHSLNAEPSTGQREPRDHQLRYLSRLGDLETTERRAGAAQDARSALAGMLVLRDDAPVKSAGCRRESTTATDGELKTRALEVSSPWAARPARAAASRVRTPWTTRSSGGSSASGSIHRARATLFASDGLLQDDRDPVAMTATLSALRRRLHAYLNWPGSARDAELHHLAAILAFRLGVPDESLGHAVRAVLAAPSSSRYRSNFAFFLHVAGRLQQATLVYEQARRLDPDNTATHLGLLSVAADSADPDLHEMEALARDWCRREKVPELARMAETLTRALAGLASLRWPALSEEQESMAGEVRLVMAMLGEFPGSAERAASRPERLEPPAPDPSSPGPPPPAGSRRSSRPVSDRFSRPAGGTEP